MLGQASHATFFRVLIIMKALIVFRSLSADAMQLFKIDSHAVPLRHESGMACAKRYGDSLALARFLAIDAACVSEFFARFDCCC